MTLFLFTAQVSSTCWEDFELHHQLLFIMRIRLQTNVFVRNDSKLPTFLKFHLLRLVLYTIAFDNELQSPVYTWQITEARARTSIHFGFQQYNGSGLRAVRDAIRLIDCTFKGRLPFVLLPLRNVRVDFKLPKTLKSFLNDGKLYFAGSAPYVLTSCGIYHYMSLFNRPKWGTTKTRLWASVIFAFQSHDAGNSWVVREDH